MTERGIRLVSSKGEIVHGKITLYDHLDGDFDKVVIRLVYDEKYMIASGFTFFDALSNIRNDLESIGMKPCCYGAVRNVFPSPMIRSMGNGEKAYRLILGKPAKSTDIVDIFDDSGDEELVEPHDQEEYYQKWLASLK